MTRILIAGAGPTGLTAALMLQHKGLRPRIVEKRPTASPLSRAVGILPSSMAIFDELDIGQRIRDRAIAIERMTAFQDGVEKFHLALDADPDPDVRLLSLPQDVTEEILAEKLAAGGIEVEYGKPVEAVEAPEGPVRVTIGGEEESYDEVLGADGGRSVVRQALGIVPRGFELPGDWSIADVDLVDPVPPRAEVHFTGHDQVVFQIAMERQRVRLVSNTPDALGLWGERLPIAGVRRTGTFRIAVEQVDLYRKGHVSLAGDAAHRHSPIGGRGMNLGIADAAEWAERLVAGTLDGYSASRHAAGKHTIGLSEGARKTLLGGHPLRHDMALTLMGLASRIPPLAQRLARRIILT